MRAEELALLLLSVVFLVLVGARVVLSGKEAPPSPATNATGPWQYDQHSPYYGVLPRDVRQFRSKTAAVVADHVCQAMGGRLHYLRKSPSQHRARMGFNCLFDETDMTISANFGDLSRIPAPIE